MTCLQNPKRIYRWGSPQLFNVQIDRVQREGGNGIIWIRIVPVIMRRCVVDGYDLYDFQPVFYASIAQFGQVGEFTYAEIILRA